MMALRRWAAEVLSTGFGLLMVGLTAVEPRGLVIAAAVAALIAVAVGIAFRPFATVAVLSAVATVLLSSPAPVLVALSGLCAAAYLVCRYSGGAPAGDWPTAVAAVGFTFAGLVATLFPWQVPWLPLAAPPAALASYVLAARPFLT